MWTQPDPLVPGASVTFTDFPIGALSSGTHTLTLVADSASAVTESDRSDNTWSRTVEVAPAGAGYLIGVSASPASGGAVSGGGSYPGATTVTVHAKPASGFQFTGWSEGGASVSGSADYSFPAGGNRNLVANFTATGIQYTVSAGASPANGGVTAGDGSFLPGTTANLTATPNSGFAFSGWWDGVTLLGTAPSLTFPVNSDRALTATFVPSLAGSSGTLYATHFEQSEGYSIMKSLSSQNGWTQNAGTDGGNGLTSNAIPGQGRHAYIGSFTPDAGLDGLTVWVPINYTPAANELVSFSTQFRIVDSTNGKTDDFLWSVYNSNGEALCMLDFDNTSRKIWYLNGSGTWVASSRRFSNDLPYDLLIRIDYDAKVWTASLGGSTLTGPQPLLATSAPADVGDFDARWFIQNTDAPGNNYMAFDNYMVTKALRGSVSSLAASASPAGGGSITGAGSFPTGTQRTVTAQAKPGYRFVNWTEAGVQKTIAPGYTFTLSGNRSLVAHFVPSVNDPWDSLDDSRSGATFLPAPGLALQSHGVHTLSSTDREDWFLVWLNKGFSYNFSAVGTGALACELFAGPYQVAASGAAIAPNLFSADFLATDTTTYFVRVHAKTAGAAARYSLRSIQRPPAANDAFARAVSIPSAGGKLTGSNTGATAETGEPSLASQKSPNSVWWVWRAPASGVYTVSTAGSSFDTVLGVFSGSKVAALKSLGQNDDASNTVRTSKVVFTAAAGGVYHIAVAGYQNDAGAIALSLLPGSR